MTPPPAVAPGITPGGAYTSVTVTMTSMPGATIYYLAASDTTTDLSIEIDPTDMSTYSGTGTTVTPATFSSAGDVYRIKAMAVLADERRTPETDIQRYDYDYVVDSDSDGLIDILNLEMFNNIRNNLAGTRYDDGSDSLAGAGGCPTAGCNGYELMANLDFADVSSYASAAVNTTWCPVLPTCIGTTQAGFPGIGAASGDTGGFTGIFEGNGNSISNFYSRNTADTTTANIGLFASNNSGTIRNIAVVNANVFGGAMSDRIGGLVGRNTGTIIASSASGSADGGAGGDDNVGGLVGYNNTGNIIASYATGNVSGGAGADDDVGGLVGINEGGTIIASYATGTADGGTGPDNVGGMVGVNSLFGTITASYATGNVNGGNESDSVGGLVGLSNSSITASYATGNVDAEGGVFDLAGSLLGQDSGGSITASYGFGIVTNEEFPGSAGSTLPTLQDTTPISSATQLGASQTTDTGNAGTSWNNATNNTLGAWDFGMTTENPALVYNDYDGTATVYALCTSDNGGFPDTIPGTTTMLDCGTTLVGGFRP